MEEFRRSYNRLCKESGAEPQEAVLQQLHQLPRGGLDLTTQSLTVDTCRALGKLLHKETLLKELVLSDCMLSEEGEASGFKPFASQLASGPVSWFCLAWAAVSRKVFVCPGLFAFSSLFAS